MSKKMILGIDFNNMIFTSYYGEKLINSKGINVNAIKGFFTRLRNLKDMFNPDYIIFANDLSRDKTFRRKIYPDYKAQRSETDADVVLQMKYASQIAALIGYPFINHESFEADDILGMISRFATDNDMEMVIASSDRDLYQLINNNVFIMSPRINELINPLYLMDNYQLTPEQWVELKMLQGDPSDNIPGIHGIGKTRALDLMHAYGSIENIYNHLSELKPAMQTALINDKDSLDLMRTLVTIVTDYKILNLTEESFKLTQRYENEIFEVLHDLELFSLYNIMNNLFIEKGVSNYETA